MGDSGEGLVDAEARIQERMEELQKAREQSRRPAVANAQQTHQLESLKLAHTELSRQFAAATHPARKTQLSAAIADVERRISEIETNLA